MYKIDGSLMQRYEVDASCFDVTGSGPDVVCAGSGRLTVFRGGVAPSTHAFRER
jgi:hypothetical protein